MTAPPTAEWWQHAPALLARLGSRAPAGGPVWYRFGDGCLGVASEDVPFADRCRALFKECAVPDPGPTAVRATCTVRVDAPTGLRLVTLDDGTGSGIVDLALRLFGERGYVAHPASGPWRALGLPSSPAAEWPLGSGPHLVVPEGGDWRPLVGSVAVSSLLARQPDVLFVHAGAVAIGGAGLVLAGPRGSGKTTVSLALASRGHDFFSDEVAAIRVTPGTLLPVRRATSIRSGPRAAGVDAALRDAPRRWETYPDGTPRLRADPADLSAPLTTGEVPLRWLLFLRRFAAAPAVEWLTPTLEHVRHLTPVGGTLWGDATAARLMRAYGLLRRVRCGYLDPGEPDATAAYLERLDTL